MFTIQVYHKNSGKHCKNAKVSVCFDGMMRGSTHYVYTNSKGEADFDYQVGNGVVFLQTGIWKSTKVYSGYLSGRIKVYC